MNSTGMLSEPAEAIKILCFTKNMKNNISACQVQQYEIIRFLMLVRNYFTFLSHYQIIKDKVEEV